MQEFRINDSVVVIDQPTDVGTIVDVKRCARGVQFIVDFGGGNVCGFYGSALLLVSAVAA